LQARTRDPTHVERRGEGCPYDIVHAGIVGVVCEVECFRSKLQGSFLAYLKGAAEAHVEVVIARPKAAIPRRTWWTVVGEMTITIDVRTGEKIKGMAAVVIKDRRKLETAQDP